MKRGDIYFIKEIGQGSVQAGEHPVIIVQNDVGNRHSPTTIVCSITSKEKPPLPTHIYIGNNGNLRKPSTILCEQIKTINKDDLEDYVGSITNQDTLKKLDKGILISLGLIKDFYD
jgi:mRNA interferase MazF